MNLSARSTYIKNIFRQHGFSDIGISKVEFLEKQATQLERWLKNNRHGKMGYMERNFDMRLNPALLVDGAKSVISLSYNYHNPIQLNNDFRVSQYAYGEDYHLVLKDKIKEILEEIQLEFGAFEHRIFTDSAPILEKAWAVKSGIGWMGENSNIITKSKGSYFFLAEVICELEFDYDTEVLDHCGDCRRYIDACPTAAITPYEVDGSKCISYFTTELKEAFDDQVPSWDDWAFGCDVCQDVCPWNRFSTPHSEPRFSSNPFLAENGNWEELDKESFNKKFKFSPIKRTKLEGILRNIQHIKAE